jgi:phosphomannomutase/phosphoglucomutase
VLAGEMSGHIFFNDRWFGFDDALYSASRLIEILSADTRNSDEVFADFPDSINTPEITIELAEGESVALMEQLFAIANFNDGNIINIDGMRVDFANGWGLVRASNTIPALVLRFEADDTETLKQIQSQFKELLHKVKPGLTIPF